MAQSFDGCLSVARDIEVPHILDRYVLYPSQPSCPHSLQHQETQALYRRLDGVIDSMPSWGSEARHEGAVAKCVGGVEDHIHVLLGLKATHSVAEVVRGIKSASSAWVHSDLGM